MNKDASLSYKIILLGDANVGKTSFIKQYIDKKFDLKNKVTCNVDFVMKTCQIDQFIVKLNIFDTAGQERYRSLTRSYFKGADAVIFMYEMSNKDSFLSLNDWVEFYEKQSQSKDQIRILVGTKKDQVVSNLKETNQEPSFSNHQKQTINSQQIKAFIQKYKFVFKFETSAKQNINIDAVFDQLTRNLIYNTLQRKKNANLIREQEWSIILKKDKQHLLRKQQNKGDCC